MNTEYYVVLSPRKNGNYEYTKNSYQTVYRAPQSSVLICYNEGLFTLLSFLLLFLFQFLWFLNLLRFLCFLYLLRFLRTFCSLILLQIPPDCFSFSFGLLGLLLRWRLRTFWWFLFLFRNFLVFLCLFHLSPHTHLTNESQLVDDNIVIFNAGMVGK